MTTTLSSSFVHAATPLRHYRAANRRCNDNNTTYVRAAGGGSDAASQKAELAAMRREVQLKSMQPSQANVVNSIIDLAQQEFGLAGEYD